MSLSRLAVTVRTAGSIKPGGCAEILCASSTLWGIDCVASPTFRMGVSPLSGGASWSSSPNANNSNNAWQLNFNNGNDNNNNRNNSYRVRLVRAGAYRW
ncbi:DUF1566 domain-containing protein [Ectothiorhodospiraceae bacterium BW-2]|nr:DUF1566 domain-containing protein [Ectothiorhodospiraceae bacterium BW-2]